MNIGMVFGFDRPTLKHVAYSIADLDPSSGGGLISTAPDRWSAAGDTLYITPLAPLAFGHLFGMKLNLVQATDSTFYTNPTYYNQVYYFTTAAQARVERVQAGNINLSITPDVTPHRRGCSSSPLPTSPTRGSASISRWRRSTSTRCRPGPSCAGTAR